MCFQMMSFHWNKQTKKKEKNWGKSIVQIGLIIDSYSVCPNATKIEPNDVESNGRSVVFLINFGLRISDLARW